MGAAYHEVGVFEVDARQGNRRFEQWPIVIFLRNEYEKRSVRESVSLPIIQDGRNDAI